MKAGELATKLMEHPNAEVWEWQGDLTIEGETHWHTRGDVCYDPAIDKVYL